MVKLSYITAIFFIILNVSYCGFGDEYRAATKENYVRVNSKKENFKDIGIGISLSIALATIGKALEKSPNLICKCVGTVINILAIGAPITTKTFD